ncbi:MAG: hypothetical protein IKC63_00360, partial [Clostridia bacterium]|nr:hypothetical protein [Clostridia bacterium]
FYFLKVFDRPFSKKVAGVGGAHITRSKALCQRSLFPSALTQGAFFMLRYLCQSPFQAVLFWE